MSPELMERLICARLLFLNGLEALTRPNPHAAALALLSFQDAAEMVLGAAADERHAKPAKEFMELIKQVESALGKSLPYVLGMKQLNTARVALKHHGILPSGSTLAKARGDSEGFIDTLVREAFGFEFSSVSLASLVEHRRTANWLREAAKRADAGDDVGCLEACAIAMALFRRAYIPTQDRHEYESILRSNQSRTGQPEIPSPVFNLAKVLNEHVATLVERLAWVSSGVSLADEQRFTRSAPRVSVTQSGHLHFTTSRHSATPEDSLFCIDFATQTVLRLQSSYQPRDRYRREPPCVFRVIKATDLFFDDDRRPPEILRTLAEGDLLAGRNAKEYRDEWIAVVDGGDWARVRRVCVELLENRVSTEGRIQ